MIVVIADDFTGAGELGGIALRYAKTAQIQTDYSLDTDCDIIIIDSNSRSLTASSAVDKIAKIAGQIAQKHTEFIYKKTDSVLRGHVRLELECLRTRLNKRRVVLIPANPSAGRTISGESYFVNDTPLHESDFANDPEYPVKTSSVLALLGKSETTNVTYANSPSELTGEGIFICQARSMVDLANWAAQINEKILPAGGADFFSTILEQRGEVKKMIGTKQRIGDTIRILYIFGSSSKMSRDLVSKLTARGFPISLFPCPVAEIDATEHNWLNKWLSQTLDAFASSRRVGIAIHQPLLKSAGIASRLSEMISELTQAVLKQMKVDEIIVEGGATASSVLNRLGWQRFRVEQEIAPGVVRMQVKNKPSCFVTVKPGSYPWPKHMW